MSTIKELDALIEELTVDAYDDEEQLSGLFNGAEEALPPGGEPASIVGVEVHVMSAEIGPDVRTGLLARVTRGGVGYEVALADLEFPAGSDFGLLVAAYRRWQGRTPRLSG